MTKPSPWQTVSTFVSRATGWKSIRAEVRFETDPVRGQTALSQVSWRVKQAADGTVYLGLKMKPDAYAGPDGHITNYIAFTPEAAEELQAGLTRCIAEMKRIRTETTTS